MNPHNFHPDPQQDPDSDLDLVLAALNAAEPEPGMRNRILAQLGAASAPPRRPRWQTPALWVPAFALVPIAFLVFATVSRRPLPAPAFAKRVPYHATPFVELPVNQPVQQPKRPHDGRAVLRPVSDAAHFDHSTPNAAHERSFPAPPIPLTAQERLLLQLASRGEPTAAAPTLDPESLAAQEAQAEARFHEKISQPPAVQLVAARSADVEQLSSSRKLTGDSQ